MKSLKLVVILLSLATAGCASDKDAYPVGRDGSVLTIRYGDNLPMTIYFPEQDTKPFPIVVYNHGRPFGPIKGGDYKLSRRFPLVSKLTAAGIAVALPVRRGYSWSGNRDGERISCNDPTEQEFRDAIASARDDIMAAIRKVKTLPDIDTGRVYVGGTSAGGFASGGSLASLEDQAKGVFVLNAGRCGKRGPLFYGHRFAAKIFSEAAATSSIPIVFYASAYDRVIPPPSTRGLYKATCVARGLRCEGSVFLIEVAHAGHGSWHTTAQASDSLVAFVRNGRP